CLAIDRLQLLDLCECGFGRTIVVLRRIAGAATDRVVGAGAGLDDSSQPRGRRQHGEKAGVESVAVADALARLPLTEIGPRGLDLLDELQGAATAPGGLQRLAVPGAGLVEPLAQGFDRPDALDK